MASNYSSTFIVFRILNSLVIFLIFYFIYKKYLKKYLVDLIKQDQDLNTTEKLKIKQLEKEYLESEKNLQNQKRDAFQIHSNLQIWQKKIDSKIKEKKQQQADLILKLQYQASKKAENYAFSKSLYRFGEDLSNDLSIKNKIAKSFDDKENQEKYIKKSLELMNEH